MTKCKVSLWDLNSVTLDFGQFIRSIHRNSEVQTMQHYAIQMQYFLMKWPKVTKPNPDLWLKRGWGLFLWKYFNFIPCPTLTIFIKTKVTWDGGLTKNGRNQVVVDVLVYLINGNLFSFFFLVFYLLMSNWRIHCVCYCIPPCLLQLYCVPEVYSLDLWLSQAEFHFSPYFL